MGHCVEKAVDPHPEVEPTIGYHTDEDTLRAEMQTLAGWREKGEPEEDDSFGV